MNAPQLTDLPAEEREWLDAYLDGTIGPSDFEALQSRMLASPGLRAVARRYLALDSGLQQAGGASDAAAAPWLGADIAPEPDGKIIRFPALAKVAAVAALAFILGSAITRWGAPPDGRMATAIPSAQGFAVVDHLVDPTWPDGTPVRAAGDTLGAEVFRLAGGAAEIQFFSGATMFVQGPAEIALKSAWQAECLEGAVRMQVPPAARGFKLNAPATEIVDLGTEFGLTVSGGSAHVEVFDGEIEVQHQAASPRLLREGAAFSLPSDGAMAPVGTGQIVYPDPAQLGAEPGAGAHNGFHRWGEALAEMGADPRLIALYTFDSDGGSAGSVPSMTLPRNPELDGSIILAEPVGGRWPGIVSALEFRRPGARVRVNIPGEFSALTFATWVRIDSLDRQYSALFMGDGYETGEPHWQIRDDGKMMLSVMIDDTRPSKYPGDTAGFHHVYFSPPIWDLSMSGQWMHLASVFDPARRSVAHFVNGEQVSHHAIDDENRVTSLRIGNGEIGNWGLPFREDPSFAIRNLNGRMDEIMIFATALSADEIAGLFANSRPDRR